MHIAFLLGVVFLSSGGLLATSAQSYAKDYGTLDVSLGCASCSMQSLYRVKDLQAAIAAVINQAKEEEEAAAAAASAETARKAAAAMARAPRAAARVLAARGGGSSASAGAAVARPTLTTRKAGLMQGPGVETVLFAEDVLVIEGIQAGWTGQYRITDYAGVTRPTEDWQYAVTESWRGVPQQCFTLPRGRMKVEVRAINPSTGEASGPSYPVQFLVRASGN